METTENYQQFLASVKEQIASAQVKTIVAANSQMLWLYWQLGDYILQNQNTAACCTNRSICATTCCTITIC
jgi:hypothetical protein